MRKFKKILLGKNRFYLKQKKDILTKNYMFLKIRNTFLPKISLKPNILEIRKFVLTMRIVIIILLHKKSYSQKDLAYYCQKFTSKVLFLEKVIFYNIFASLKNN